MPGVERRRAAPPEQRRLREIVAVVAPQPRRTGTRSGHAAILESYSSGPSLNCAAGGTLRPYAERTRFDRSPRRGGMPMLAVSHEAILRPFRRVALLLLAPLLALLPFAAHAGAPSANPAAVRFTIAMQAQTPDGSFSLSGNGVADTSGDVQLHMDLNGP